MRTYQLGNTWAVSTVEIPELNEVGGRERKASQEPVVWLHDKGNRARMYFQESDLPAEQPDGISVLNTLEDKSWQLPEELRQQAEAQGIQAINVQQFHWQEHVGADVKKPWKVHVLGLGDVGGTLLTGLRLLADEALEEIGIFDLNTDRRKRWALELNQIVDPNRTRMVPVTEIEMGQLFECDMFVFCASKAIPEVGSDVKDVRMAQYEANAQIVEIYAKMARKARFKGIFAVVSDPVDLLCKVVWDRSNRDDKGKWDGTGLLPEQVRGYGLGVMYARASYYARQEGVDFSSGRAFGPHGKDLIIANSTGAYDESISAMLTDKTVKANLEVRNVGYKPFIAPALSSGAISLLHTIWGNWHYSAVYLDGAWMGCRNRRTPYGDQVERTQMADTLYEKIRDVHERLFAHA